MRSCILCQKSITKSKCFPIFDIPFAAQGFTKNRKSSQLKIKCNLYQCDNCGHVQLDVDPVEYYKNVIRSVGISDEMKTYREVQFTNLRKEFFSKINEVNVLEVGSASGEYSQLLADVFFKVTATEKGKIGFDQTQAKGIECIKTHPDDEDFLSKLESKKFFDLICCFSYIEHLPNPIQFLNKCRGLLSENGYLLIELPNSEMIFRDGLLNEVIPDHLSYFTTSTAVKMFSNSGFEVLTSYTSWDDYIITFVCRKNVEKPIERMFLKYECFKKEVTKLIEDEFKNCSKFVVWGAGHQSLFTIATTNLKNKIDYIVDSSPSKQGLYAPGSGIPIMSPTNLKEDNPDVIIVACAGYNNEVVKMLKSYNLNTKYIYVLNGLNLKRV